MTFSLLSLTDGVMSIEYSCTQDLTFYQCLTQAVGKEVSILRLKNEAVEEGPVLLSSAHLEPYPICLHWSVFVLLGKLLIVVHNNVPCQQDQT